MKKFLIVPVATLLIAGVAVAAPAEKVFVCKFVGKPGVDERLQTGNNPISVNSNAIPNYQGVGSYFADGQNRSYVLAVDSGQPEPNVSQCPQPTVTPPTPPVVPPTPTPTPTPTPGTTTTTVTTEPNFAGFVGK